VGLLKKCQLASCCPDGLKVASASDATAAVADGCFRVRLRPVAKVGFFNSPTVTYSARQFDTPARESYNPVVAELNRDTPEAPDSAAEAGTSNFEPPQGTERFGFMLSLTGELPAAGTCGRAVVPADKEALAVLMLDAYRDTVDYNNETLADAVSEIEHTLSGSYGRFLAGCSFVAAGEGASPATLFHKLPGAVTGPGKGGSRARQDEGSSPSPELHTLA